MHIRPAEGTQAAACATDALDSPCKTLLERWARPFVECCFPVAATYIDWSKGLECLNKEPQQFRRETAPARTGRRREIDTLINVCPRGAEETRAPVLVEIQAQAPPDRRSLRRSSVGMPSGRSSAPVQQRET